MNKKGFTLIELLAVIVILAIIALIATPIVLNIIKDSRESAGLRSAEMYLKGVETSVATATIKNKKLADGTYPITPDGDICLVDLEDNTCDKDNTLEVEMNGEKPESGTVIIVSGKVTDIAFTYSNGKTVVKNDKGKLEYKNYIAISNYRHKHINGKVEDHEVTFDENGHGICNKCKEEVLAAGLYDESDNLVASWDVLVNDYGLDIEEDGNGSVAQSYQPETSATKILSNGALKTGIKLVINNDVSHIGSGQFASLFIKEVIIPESVTSMGGGVFYSASGITEIEIPSSVKDFSGTFQYNGSIKNVKLGDGITKIPNAAFSDCVELTSVNIPSSVTSIGSTAFSNTKLTSITIPDNVTSIGGGAFNRCTNLTSVYIPKSVTTITANMSGSVSNYPPFNYCSSTLKIYTGVKEGEIPSGWGQYWNYYNSGKTLDVTYGVTREEYEELIKE